ncbi:hypothetical protein K437DRAFT_77274 [Tilletiaria anomala UBC 951]|uniref:Amino acid transporter transmembrane domain-containing protein n=1 Tax=Tilletiaria anomala (strain ATCC 24038 / CBS 436.72 / UBC 951) TaxID=1037660 RepID=A0A066WET7_TILAU|nr:uncharacterized protein K437DRAFT_77274 [Tilletiaria anomala UBC 951]KDN49604.1 hypothetical protein K437DRAFT_77274 [Tilletiaria anomala UBC 951]
MHPAPHQLSSIFSPRIHSPLPGAEMMDKRSNSGAGSSTNGSTTGVSDNASALLSKDWQAREEAVVRAQRSSASLGSFVRNALAARAPPGLLSPSDATLGGDTVASGRFSDKQKGSGTENDKTSGLGLGLGIIDPNAQISTATLQQEAPLRFGSKLTFEQRKTLFEKELFASAAATATDPEKEGGSPLSSRSFGKQQEIEKMGYLKAFFNLAAFCIAVVVLSAPNVMATIGIIPTVLIALLFSVLAFWAGMQYYHFRIAYPGISNLEDAGYLLFGRVGREFFGCSQVAFSIFLQGSHCILGSQALYALGWHGCSLALGAVWAIISFIFNFPRDYSKLGGLAVAAISSILIAIVYTIIIAGISGPQLPAGEAVAKNIQLFGTSRAEPLTTTAALLQVANIFLSFGANTAYFPIMCEMKNVRHFPRTLAMLIALNVIVYLGVGLGVYLEIGQYVVAPAFDSLPPVHAKAVYGIALVTIVIAGCESGQIAAKQIFVRIFRDRPYHMQTNTFAGWATWIGINACTWFLAWLVSSLIPVFPQFLGLESSLLWVLFSIFASVFWFHLNKGRWFVGTAKHKLNALVASASLGVMFFVMAAGIYASIASIVDSYNDPNASPPKIFSCAHRTA